MSAFRLALCCTLSTLLPQMIVLLALAFDPTEAIGETVVGTLLITSTLGFFLLWLACVSLAWSWRALREDGDPGFSQKGDHLAILGLILVQPFLLLAAWLLVFGQDPA